MSFYFKTMPLAPNMLYESDGVEFYKELYIYPVLKTIFP